MTNENQHDRVDPADVSGINAAARTWAKPGQRIHPIPIERIIVAADALDSLAAEVAQAAARAPASRVLLVTDRTPMRRGGGDLKSQISNLLSRTVDLDTRILPDQPATALHADIDTARKLGAELQGFAVVVSVGSGSVTDVVKYARHLSVEETNRPLPFVCFPTAASVTAYTSSLAVLEVDGVKRTLPARPPDAVVCDLQTLADAPPSMTQAGFGDVLARGVSYGDWYLAAQLGMDDGFSEVPGRLLDRAEREMIEKADGLARHRDAAGADGGGVDIDAARAVTEALLLAGMAMSLVNQTAPLSGWEHTISHFLDLTAAHEGRTPALHGGQVGVATLVAARAYERAWDKLDLERLTADRDDAAYMRAIERGFGAYDSSGAMTAELWRDFERKLNRWRAAADARRAFVERARRGEIDAFLRSAVRSPAEIDDALRRAGAPRRFADLDQPIGPATAHAAVCHAHLIRARFTLGDLLAETGWLSEAAAAGLLDAPA